MVSRGHLQLSAKEAEQLLPELGGEAGITVRYYIFWKTVMFEHCVDEQCCSLCRGDRFTDGFYMDHLTESVNPHYDTGASLPILRQAEKEIHRDGFPTPLRNWKTLQRSLSCIRYTHPL